MDAKQLKGAAVVSVADGEKLGSIDDVLLDAVARRIEGLRVESGGLLSRTHQVIPYSAIHSVGPDAVMVPDKSVLHDTSDAVPAAPQTLAKLGDLRVVTEDGTYLGDLATVHFDPQSGTITEFEIATGSLGGVLGKNTLFDAGAITSVGADIMVVPSPRA